eukprot:scaffold85229_cov17-Tisochrysis_lutea.AAC.1
MLQFLCTELVVFIEACCAPGLHVFALSQPNSPPVCLNPLAAPPSLQLAFRMYPECPGGHTLLAGAGCCQGGCSRASQEEC